MFVVCKEFRERIEKCIHYSQVPEKLIKCVRTDNSLDDPISGEVIDIVTMSMVVKQEKKDDDDDLEIVGITSVPQVPLVPLKIKAEKQGDNTPTHSSKEDKLSLPAEKERKNKPAESRN